MSTLEELQRELDHQRAFVGALVQFQNRPASRGGAAVSCQGLLGALCGACAAEGAYVYETLADAPGSVIHLAHWREAGGEMFPRHFVLHPRWLQLLLAGSPVLGLKDSFPATEAAFFVRFAAPAVSLFPMLAGGEFFGFLGMVSSAPEHLWAGAELDFLRIAARDLAMDCSRRRAETRRAAAEAQHGAILKAAIEGVVTFDRHGHIMDVNPAGRRSFESGSRELPAAGIDQIVIDETHLAGLGGMLARISGGGAPAETGPAVVDVELTARKPDGTSFPIELSLTSTTANREPFFAAALSDLTLRREREAQLRLLEAAVYDLEESVLITDSHLSSPGPRIVFTNPAFSRVTGYTAEEVLGKNPRILHGPKTQRAVLDQVRARLTAGEPFEGETINYRKDGTEFLHRWHISPVRDRSGEITHFVAVQSDRTEGSRVEAELLQSRKLRALGEVTSGVAHEFNNLLQPMIIELVQIRRNRELPAAVAASLATVEAAVGSATELCQRVLGLGRKSPDNIERVSLNEQVRNNVELLRSAVDHRIAFDLKFAGGLAPLCLSRGQLSQIVMNLCINARDTLLEKAAHAGDLAWVPRIELRTFRARGARPGAPGLEPSQLPQCQCLAVRDTGCGMSAEIRERIFQPFFTTKSTLQGTGLGLAVTWNLVDALGGWIEVESHVGMGTEFRVWFPEPEDAAVPAAPVLPVAQPPPAAAEKAPCRVLLVEDNEGVARTFSSLLESAGHQVRWVANGATAWQILQLSHGDYDLVISDLNMPGLLGTELFQLISTLPYAGHIALITGYLSPEHEAALTRHGVSKVLLKPVGPDELLTMVKACAPVPA